MKPTQSGDEKLFRIKHPDWVETPFFTGFCSVFGPATRREVGMNEVSFDLHSTFIFAEEHR
jgi:hypothetical protein